MATAASLQGHFDEISAQAAVLPLAAAPRGFAQLDIATLADGPESSSRVSSILNKAAAGLQECQICGSSCSAGQLGFVVTTQLDFAARSVRAAAGQFACEVCRALSSPGLLLELSMPVPQSEDFTRAEQLRELFLHFAAVNSAPERITRNPEALALWVQELASRAYSMHVVASSLKGWQLHSPSGQLVQPGAAGAALQLLQELLKRSSSGSKPGKSTSGKHKQKQQQQPLVAAVGKPAKRKSVEVAPEAAAAATAAGSSKKKAKKQAGTPAAAAAAAVKDHSVRQEVLTPKQPQQVKTPKQEQQQQQQAGQTPKVHRQLAKTPEASAAADEQQLLQAGGSSIKKKKKLSSQPHAAQTLNRQAPAGTPGKKLKKSAAAAAVPFKTLQVAKAKKAKRRLSAQ